MTYYADLEVSSIAELRDVTRDVTYDLLHAALADNAVTVAANLKR